MSHPRPRGGRQCPSCRCCLSEHQIALGVSLVVLSCASCSLSMNSASVSAFEYCRDQILRGTIRTGLSTEALMEKLNDVGVRALPSMSICFSFNYRLSFLSRASMMWTGGTRACKHSSSSSLGAVTGRMGLARAALEAVPPEGRKCILYRYLRLIQGYSSSLQRKLTRGGGYGLIRMFAPSQSA